MPEPGAEPIAREAAGRTATATTRASRRRSRVRTEFIQLPPCESDGAGQRAGPCGRLLAGGQDVCLVEQRVGLVDPILRLLLVERLSIECRGIERRSDLRGKIVALRRQTRN